MTTRLAYGNMLAAQVASGAAPAEWAELARRFVDVQAAFQREVAAGTHVRSYLLHMHTPVSTTLVGEVVLPEPILAVCVLTATLGATDASVGAPGATYPVGGNRGTELDGTDFVAIGDDNRTITFLEHTQTAIDEVRIITAAP